MKRPLDRFLACPLCQGDLVSQPETYTCPVCVREFPIRYGIPDFRLEADPYISIGAEMAKIDGFMSTGRTFADMVRAYYALTPESPPSLHLRYMDAMDAAVMRGAGMIKKLRQRFPRAGTMSMLDLGCGTGGMTIAGSHIYQNAIGVDVALRWLVMGRQRLMEAGIDAPMVCANAEALPFRTGAFDAVLADAVIEHVRDSELMRDQALRVLAPGGAWFFVTNNRYSALPEPHVRLWGFGLLPRSVMERVSWAVRKTPYKARLHSRSDLRRIFKGRGEVMLPWFDAGELGPRNERIRRTWETLRSVPVLRSVIGAIVPQYFIAGERERTKSGK